METDHSDTNATLSERSTTCKDMEHNEYYSVLLASQRAYDLAASAESSHMIHLVDADVLACSEMTKEDIQASEIESAILYRLQSNPASNYVPYRYTKAHEGKNAGDSCGDAFDYLDLNSFDDVFES